MTSTTPRTPGRETSGHTGAGLIGDLHTGIEAGAEARDATERARARDASLRGVQVGGDADVAGGPATSTPAGVSRIGSGTTGLNNYSPGSDLSAGLGAETRHPAAPTDDERSPRPAPGRIHD
jgi:hypothetical protein